MEPEPTEKHVVNVLVRAREEARAEYTHRARHTDDPHEAAALREEKIRVIECLTEAITIAGGDPSNVEPTDLERIAREGP